MSDKRTNISFGRHDGDTVLVTVTTEDKELKEKAKTFERLLQYIVDDHIKVFGLHDDMLKPGITKIGFDDKFELEVTKVPYTDFFIGIDKASGESSSVAVIFDEFADVGVQVDWTKWSPTPRGGFLTNTKST